MSTIFAVDINLNTVMILIVALVNAYTALVTVRTHDQIKTLEQNTNSIKDALVASTAKASRAEGVKAGEEGRP